jgi:phosphatidylethanolamine/phosphatidyl-N-methylethanolamine N-methyltransferase
MTQNRQPKRRKADLDNDNIIKAYARWAPFYDMVFGKITTEGRRKAIAAVNRVGGRALEVGVGTGIALPEYNRQMRITGIDVSSHMLERAHQRVKDENLTHVERLSVMDATKMDFEDNSFDVAVAMYLITVVPDPAAVLAEMERVVRPGGEVILINHFGADRGPRAKVEKMLAERAHILGWRADFPLERVMCCDNLEVVEKTPVPPFGMFTVLRFVKKDPAASGLVEEPAVMTG